MLLAGGGALRAYNHDDRHWMAGIAGLPTIVAQLAYEGSDYSGGGVPQATELTWQPARPAEMDRLASLYWADARIDIRVGPEDRLPIPSILSGRVLEATVPAPGTLRIALADPAAELRKAFPVDRYGGTGGIEGPAEWNGLVRDRIWGRVWNRPGSPIDKANNIYCFADPARPIAAIDAVRDKGATAAALVDLEWAGSVDATFAALQAAAAPQGGGVRCPSIACVKWWTQPAGDLTADLHGEVGVAYVETAPGIVGRLVEAAGGPRFADGEIAAAARARPAPVGWVIRDENAPVDAMLDRLLGDASLTWLLDGKGTIVIRRWEWGAAIATAESEQVTRLAMHAPVFGQRIGYRRNELPMARGELAAIVLAPDVEFLDGSTAEALKPAEPAADVASAIEGLATITIKCDHNGAPLAGQLPRTIGYKLKRGGLDVTEETEWETALLTGTGMHSIGAATGVLTITAVTSALRIAVRATYPGGAQRSFEVQVVRELAPPPTGDNGTGAGTGGTSASGSISGSPADTTMVAVGPELAVTIGSLGEAQLSASYTYSVNAAAALAYARWYRWNGSVYAGIGTEQAARGTATETGSEPGVSEPSEGYGECAHLATGLTDGASEKFRLYARSSVANQIFMGGSCSAVGG